MGVLCLLLDLLVGCYGLLVGACVIVNSGVVCVWFTYSCGFVVLDFG